MRPCNRLSLTAMMLIAMLHMQSAQAAEDAEGAIPTRNL